MWIFVHGSSMCYYGWSGACSQCWRESTQQSWWVTFHSTFLFNVYRKTTAGCFIVFVALVFFFFLRVYTTKMRRKKEIIACLPIKKEKKLQKKKSLLCSETFSSELYGTFIMFPRVSVGMRIQSFHSHSGDSNRAEYVIHCFQISGYTGQHLLVL